MELRGSSVRTQTLDQGLIPGSHNQSPSCDQDAQGLGGNPSKLQRTGFFKREVLPAARRTTPLCSYSPGRHPRPGLHSSHNTGVFLKKNKEIPLGRLFKCSGLVFAFSEESSASEQKPTELVSRRTGSDNSLGEYAASCPST